MSGIKYFQTKRKRFGKLGSDRKNVDRQASCNVGKEIFNRDSRQRDVLKEKYVNGSAEDLSCWRIDKAIGLPDGFDLSECAMRFVDEVSEWAKNFLHAVKTLVFKPWNRLRVFLAVKKLFFKEAAGVIG